ncbi:LysR substrate-binding domain-containing protein [Sphingobium chlorophenolicum]|uniref:Transcriptional regulator, LysR family n=1 Tax=Sphingobium chlorophenolicum TaxID=46429 RepID=A0A081RBY7_SPHCR|nr:LysR substrate-binding domain-containing protein [Sphingobium chlorophenolicum]KEQ52710.1 Transcriptional regulator, LysR family [Sphingobium chlorophenolicum]
MSKWEGLDEFMAVAAASSFTGAARSLSVSTTHVSRAVMALEQRINAQLFYRTTRTVRLTDTGRVFLEQCRRIAAETDEAIAHIAEQGEPAGELRVTCSTAMGERYVAPLIRRFAMHHPRLSVSIELTNRVVDLMTEDFDLAIRTGTISDPRLIKTRIASRRLYTCAAPDYLARAGRPTTVEEIGAHECIGGTSGSWHFKVDGVDVSHRPIGRFRCNSGHAVVDACVAGLGICQLPEFYVLPHLQHGMVELILEDCRPDDEPIWAVYPQRRHLVPKIHFVVEHLRRELEAAMTTRSAQA